MKSPWNISTSGCVAHRPPRGGHRPHLCDFGGQLSVRWRSASRPFSDLLQKGQAPLEGRGRASQPAELAFPRCEPLENQSQGCTSCIKSQGPPSTAADKARARCGKLPEVINASLGRAGSKLSIITPQIEARGGLFPSVQITLAERTGDLRLNTDCPSAHTLELF